MRSVEVLHLEQKKKTKFLGTIEYKKYATNKKIHTCIKQFFKVRKNVNGTLLFEYC